jgi:MFS transporter, ACS family, hexuronate transporter
MNKKLVLVSILCGFGYMMYSVDRMVMSSSIGLIVKDFGLSKGQSGLLMSAFFYGFIAFLFIAGIFSDKLSSKWTLIIGVLLFSLFSGLTGLSTGLGTMLVYRILTGVGEGLFWPAASHEIAKVTTEKQRTTVMSLYWSGYPIGGFFGTWLGAIIGPRFGWPTVFFVACFLGIAIAILYAILVKQDSKNVSVAKKADEPKVPLSTLFKHRSIIIMSLYYFVALSAWWIVLLWTPTFLEKTKGMSLGVAGTIASLSGIAGALGGYFIGRYCDFGALGRRKTVLVFITVVTGLLMSALVLDLPTWLTAVDIFLIGFFGYPITPIVLALTSQIVPKGITGSALGLVTNIGMAAGAISPLLLGIFSETYSMSSIWLVASAVMLVSIVLLFGMEKMEYANTDSNTNPKAIVS